jgi:hypothetical protein
VADTIRDILVIILALESIIVFGLLAWLILQVRSTVKYLTTEVKPVLDSINETVTTVQKTTTFLSDTVVTPVIRGASYAAGATQAFRSFTRNAGSDRKQV